MRTLFDAISKATTAITAQTSVTPSIGIILGTGLGNLTSKVSIDTEIAYNSIPHFPQSTVESHKGAFVFGELAGKNVVIMNGRFHYYEGYSLQDVTFPIRVMKALGIKSLIITNAAGGMNATYDKGDIVVVTDHINLAGVNPLVGVSDERFGERFVDMCDPYAERLIKISEAAARELRIPLKRGVYAWVSGPSLETRAEYKFMHMIGADLVGMSTVPEVIVGMQAGIEVLALSCVTDLCIPESLKPVNIQEIIKTAEEAGPKMDRLINVVVEKM